jgi:hypothetical protein
MSYRFLNFITLFFSIISFISCNHFSTKDAVHVNDEVVHHQKKLKDALSEFVASLESKNETTISNALLALKAVSDTGLSAVSEMISPECNESFLEAAKSLFDYYATACATDYERIATYYGADSITYEAYDSLETLVEKFKQDQDIVNQAFLSAQQSFSKDCGFKLIENED